MIFSAFDKSIVKSTQRINFKNKQDVAPKGSVIARLALREIKTYYKGKAIKIIWCWQVQIRKDGSRYRCEISGPGKVDIPNQ